MRLLLPAAVLALCTAAVMPLAGESVDLVAWVSQTGAEMEWEPVRELGRITRGHREVIVRVGFPFVILDGKRSVPAPPPRREGGTVLLPEETARIAAAHLIEGPGPRVAVVLIDPGHGGKDPGAVGRHAVGGKAVVVEEKAVTLEVGRALRDLLAARYPDKRVELTREDDSYVSLEERTRRANEIQVGDGEAIIFVSLHVNASLVAGPKGFEVWYLPPEVKRDLSDRTGVDAREIAPILGSMLEVEYLTESVILARDIVDGLAREVGEESENRGIKEESWFVVRNSKMPAVLVELGFITNPVEGLKLRDQAYLRRLAAGVYSGIERFIERFESSKGFTTKP